MTLLLDSMVVIEGHAGGWFHDLSVRVQVGVASQVQFESTYFKSGADRVAIDLSGCIADGRVELVTATATELEHFAQTSPFASRLGPGETESLALVLSRGHSFCTADRLAMSAMKHADAGPKWRALETVFLSVGLNTDGLGKHYKPSCWETA